MKLRTAPVTATVVALLTFGLVLLAGGAPLAAAEQQEGYTFTVGLLGGFGGALDANPDPGLNQTNWLLAAGMITAPRTLVVVRTGRLSIDGDPAYERFSQADVDYLNVAGEYRFAQPTYDYGMYLGLGYYRLKGDLLAGGTKQETDVGIVLGMTGDFDLTQHLSIIAEISGHYVFFNENNLFAMADVGLAVHF